jgi:predicted nucleotidyltransferase
MITQFQKIDEPINSEVYVFGSYLSSPSPDDIDILIVYDQGECDAAHAFERHSNLMQEISLRFNLRVDAALLTKTEEAECSFVSRSGAINITALPAR